MEKREIIRVALYSSLGTLFAVLLIGVGGYFAYTVYLAGWIQSYEIKRESNAILSEVGKAVLLPVDEEPQIAKVIDAEALKQGDEFFKDATDGDVTVYYPRNGIVILYSLERHKLLNIGNLATSTTDYDTHG